MNCKTHQGSSTYSKLKTYKSQIILLREGSVMALENKLNKPSLFRTGILSTLVGVMASLPLVGCGDDALPPPPPATNPTPIVEEARTVSRDESVAVEQYGVLIATGLNPAAGAGFQFNSADETNDKIEFINLQNGDKISADYAAGTGLGTLTVGVAPNQYSVMFTYDEASNTITSADLTRDGIIGNSTNSLGNTFVTDEATKLSAGEFFYMSSPGGSTVQILSYSGAFIGPKQIILSTEDSNNVVVNFTGNMTVPETVFFNYLGVSRQLILYEDGRIQVDMDGNTRIGSSINALVKFREGVDGSGNQHLAFANDYLILNADGTGTLGNTADAFPTLVKVKSVGSGIAEIDDFATIDQVPLGLPDIFTQTMSYMTKKYSSIHPMSEVLNNSAAIRVDLDGDGAIPAGEELSIPALSLNDSDGLVGGLGGTIFAYGINGEPRFLGRVLGDTGTTPTGTFYLQDNEFDVVAAVTDGRPVGYTQNSFGELVGTFSRGTLNYTIAKKNGVYYCTRDGANGTAPTQVPRSGNALITQKR